MKMEKHDKTFQAECTNCQTVNITNDVINKDQLVYQHALIKILLKLMFSGQQIPISLQL